MHMAIVSGFLKSWRKVRTLGERLDALPKIKEVS
jgi:hypothetical protein